METLLFSESGAITVILVSILVFIARTLDVSTGTMRIIFVSRGRKFPAAVCGFIETLIWLFAVGQIIQNLTNPAYYIAFAGGFASGTFVGIWIEEKLAMGSLLLRFITKKDATELIDHLRSEGYGVTSVEAKGMSGLVHVFFTIIKRRDIERVVNIIKRFNPNAFYSIEDVRFVTEPVKSATKFLFKEHHLGLRKGK